MAFEDETVYTRFYGSDPDEVIDLIGKSVVIQATVDGNGRQTFLRSPSLSRITGRIDPVYVGAQGLVSGEVVESAVQSALKLGDALNAAANAIHSSQPAMEVLGRHGITPLPLLQGLHAPQSLALADLALRVAKECCINEVKAAARPSRIQLATPYNLDDALIKVVAEQPETLSESQRSALNVIRKACNSNRPAHILLNGDVGSGKTLVFLTALAAIARASGGKVAVLVPSDLVARQIYANAAKRFPDLFPCIVSGDPAVDAKQEQMAASSMFIGTQALLTRELPCLEALVVDEQHKLSVDQRGALLGLNTHVIEASATPIPRTLALALYDGWTYAVIKHSPVAKTIHSHVVNQDDRATISKMVMDHLGAGRKVVFLYPSVAGKGDGVIKKAEALGAHFPGKVAMLHGKLKPAEKIRALESFREGTCPIVVASTAIEVGVDVPDIGLMVVLGADRFGVSQLHQLRGRLVRNGGMGDFVMAAPSKIKAPTRKRLDAVAQHADGFSLAQRDLELRGFGELLGDAQVGDSTTLFKLNRLEPEDFLPR
ncbi:MAG: DEAD/DEAH box helicase [Limnohabitans sp.]|uniref:helicase-related protein n=1 Tax=Limnohabitans sp. TaxID=1907725 RepID=UPI0025D57EBC|nr:helicase-related protein [Limnohabitans sp.]MCO4087458.1 DEAD/DEAH box helicase [Limnohabitans sp.]